MSAADKFAHSRNAAFLALHQQGVLQARQVVVAAGHLGSHLDVYALLTEPVSAHGPSIPVILMRSVPLQQDRLQQWLQTEHLREAACLHALPACALAERPAPDAYLQQVSRSCCVCSAVKGQQAAVKPHAA